VEVDQVRVGMSCGGLVRAPVDDLLDAYPPVVGTRCDFATEVVVRNPEPAPQAVEIEVHARSAERVTRDLGRGAIAAPEGIELSTVDAIELGPGEARALRTRGVVYPSEDFWERASVRALSARHPVLAWDGGERRLSFAMQPDTWSFRVERPPVALRVEHPASWSLEASGVTRREWAPEGAAPGARAEELASEAAASVRGALIPPVSLVDLGGPVLGLGVVRAGARGEGDDPPWRFDAALGLEIGTPQWVIASVLVDSDFDRRLAAALAVEAATPYVRLGSVPLPSLAAGLGLPVRFLDETAVGLRLQLTVSFPSIGFTAYVDYFPELDRPEQVLLLRGSL
jgi:hypothetical protein